MSKPRYRRGACRLNLGLSGSTGDRKMEFLMIGVLGLIIVGALVITAVSVFGGDKRQAGGDAETRYHCEACGHEWARSMDELDPEEATMREGACKLKCPNCGEQEGLPMTQCPKCDKWYVSPQIRSMAEYRMSPDGPRPGAEPAPDVCPHCGTNRTQWFHEQRRKKD